MGSFACGGEVSGKKILEKSKGEKYMPQKLVRAEIQHGALKGGLALDTRL